ncbi:uncharacterized protein L203_104696 [Cryptococcus depauperatus CBS 7841]|uniref:Uncharacterized protein n=1 Tax=Cryptococcus depauperatus CBS 7841 TaxID=1295531 RepID=A0AAJ8JW43_9TREE
MVVANSPTTSSASTQSPVPLSPTPASVASAVPPLQKSFSLKRHQKSRRAKRARSDGESYAFEDNSLTRLSWKKEMDSDCPRGEGIDDGQGSSPLLEAGWPVTVPSLRPVVRARPSKIKTGRRIEFSTTSTPELSSVASADPEPVAKRQRQRSCSASSASSFKGLLVTEKKTPPPSPQSMIEPEFTTPRKKRGSLYVPSPLATASIISPSLSASNIQDAPLSPVPVLAATEVTVEIEMLNTAATQVKGRQKVWSDVEDLEAELGNVLRLGFGRGLGRGISGRGEEFHGPGLLIYDFTSSVRPTLYHQCHAF